jgi:hypothetical protein
MVSKFLAIVRQTFLQVMLEEPTVNGSYTLVKHIQMSKSCQGG